MQHMQQYMQQHMQQHMQYNAAAHAAAHAMAHAAVQACSSSSVQAEWEGMTLPQQQKPSPITIYQIQPIDVQIGVALVNCEQELINIKICQLRVSKREI